MKILLTAATLPEILPVMEGLALEEGRNLKGSTEITVLIAGVGMVATAFSLGRLFAGESFDFAVNAGIAGSFDRKIPSGEVVVVDSDCFAELGAEDDEQFIPIDELGFGRSQVFPLAPPVSLPSLPRVSGITVNTVHGNERSIRKVLQRCSAATESMEGAAFFYSCNEAQVPSVQIRGISNYVERRNRDNWQIGLAIARLNEELKTYITSII